MIRVAVFLVFLWAASAQFVVYQLGNMYYSSLWVAPLYPQVGKAITFYTGGLGDHSFPWKLCSGSGKDFPVVIVGNSTGVFAVQAKYRGTSTFLTGPLDKSDPLPLSLIQC